MFRRQFLIMKRVDQIKLDQMFTEHSVLSDNLSEYRKLDFPDIRTELRYLLKLVRQFGVNEVYAKELGTALDGELHVVRVISPQCEPVKLDHWAPGYRCLAYCSRYMHGLAEKKSEESVEEDDPSESWKNG
jgi:ribosomal protein S12 methylthiotransferase accessory factor YcaO